MNIKKAFTLMELIVAASIIAVISVIMIKTVFSNQPNKNQLMIKKVYTETSNIVSQMVNNEDIYGSASTSNGSNFSNTGKIKYKGVEYGGESESADAKSKFCNIFKTYLNIAKTNNSCDTANVTLENGGHFTTTDGVVWVMPYGEFSNQEEIIVDVASNGSADTNCTTEEDTDLTRCATGPDQFKILVNQDGSIEVPVTDKVLRYYLNHSDYKQSYKQIKDKAVKQSDNNTIY